MKHTQSVSRFFVIAWSLLVVSIVAVPTHLNAVPVSVDVTGRWMLTVEDICIWKGPMDLTQTIDMLPMIDFTGSAMLGLVSGGTGCPAMLDGTITGMISGLRSGFFIEFGLASGQLGTVNFSGTLSDDGQSASGTYVNETDGTWSAEKQRAVAVAVPAPALSGAGLVVMFALLTAVGVVSARRRAL